MSNYKPIYSLFKNLYFENSPILIEAGVLFCNRDISKYHIQLKLKNLTDLPIIMVKVDFILKDAIGREICHQQKQYLDLKALPNQSFGANDPCFLIGHNTRQFDVQITEVCFADKSVWAPASGVTLEQVPFVKPLSNVYSARAIAEFRLDFCHTAQFIPFKHKDLWVCACGNVNKSTHERCCSCNASFSAMTSTNQEVLEKNNVYREAMYWASKNEINDINRAIGLLSSIADWKDSQEQIEKLQEALILAEERERAAQEEIKAKEQEKIEKRKGKKVKALALCVTIAILLVLTFSTSFLLIRNAKYNKALSYIEDHEYAKALEILEDINGYKDSDNMHLLAKYMVDGDYLKAIEKFNLTEIYIPYGVTEIKNHAFYECSSLKKVVIPDSVTTIGYSAFSKCANLTEIVIPKSVTSIGVYAFYYCSSLTHIKYEGSQEQWLAITKGNRWSSYAGSFTITYNYEV